MFTLSQVESSPHRPDIGVKHTLTSNNNNILKGYMAGILMTKSVLSSQKRDGSANRQRKE